MSITRIARYLATCAILASTAHADPGDNVRQFADHLFEQEDFYRAITEYTRLLVVHPERTDGARSEYAVAMAYFRGSHFRVARQHFTEITNVHAGRPAGIHAAVMVAWCLIKEDQYHAAADWISVRRRSIDRAIGKELRIHVEALCRIMSEDPETARQLAEELPPSPSATLATRQALDRLQHNPGKSPWLAGTLSAILPGAGQLYVGKRSDALLSFLINGSLIAASVIAFENDEEVAGGLIAALEAGWYVGNIYNAANAAHKHRRARRLRLLDRAEIQCLAVPDSGTVKAGFGLRLGF